MEPEQEAGVSDLRVTEVDISTTLSPVAHRVGAGCLLSRHAFVWRCCMLGFKNGRLRLRVSRRLLAVLGAIAAAAAIAVGVAWAYSPNLIELLLGTQDQTKLRPNEPPLSAASDDEPALLVLAIDGVDRDLLYELLDAGELPALARLLGGKQGESWPHAHFEQRLLAAMPTSTLAAWATVFTGEPPARHGIAGNEFFIREQRRMAAPAPVSITNPDPVMATYTDGSPTTCSRCRRSMSASRGATRRSRCGSR